MGRRIGLGGLAVLLAAALAAPASATGPTITEYTAGIPAGAAPNGIAQGPDGAMWFTERDADAIGRIASDGTVTQFPSSGNGLSAGADPASIVTGPDGKLYFTEYGTSAIGELDPSTGQLVGEYPTPTPGAGPDGIAVGSDGGIWFAEQSGSQIGRLDPTTHAITEYPIQLDTHIVYTPTDLVSGPDGALWLTLNGNGEIARLDLSAASPGTAEGITLYDLPAGSGSEPEGIVSGPDGDLYVAEHGVSDIAQIAPGSVSDGTDEGITEFPAGGHPLWLSNAGDGAIWATDNVGDQLLRFDLTSDTGTAFGSGQGVNGDATTDAQDASGNVWFTEFSSDRVGEVATAPPPPPPPPQKFIPPHIGGTPTVGSTVECDEGAWTNSPTGFTFQWLLDGEPIDGQTSATFKIPPADVLQSLTCAVTATNAGGSTTATTAAVTVAIAPLQPAGLNAMGGAPQSGKPLLLQASGAASVVRYSYQFANGAEATCGAAAPVLSAVFDGATSGVVKLTETSSTGQSTSTTAPYSVLARKVKGAREAKITTRLIGYACSQTAAKAPQNTLLNKAPKCLLPAVEDGGYVSMMGCMSEVPLSSLSKDDRGAIPFANNGRFIHGFVPSKDATDDAYFASYGQVEVNGLTITPSAGHAVILVEGGGATRKSSDSILKNPNGYYLVSGGATVTVSAPGTDGHTLQLTGSDRPISWDVSSSTNANGKPPPGSTAKLADVKLSNVASGIPGIGWLAAQVIETADIDQTLTSLSFAIAGDGDYVTNLPIDITNLPFGNNASADVVVQADNANGLQLGEFKLTIPNVFVGPLQFENVDVQYTRDGTQSPSGCSGVSTQQANSLIGCAQVVIAQGLVSGTMVISDVGGKPSLSYFHVDYVGNLSLFGAATLTKFTGDLDPSTDSLDLNAHLSVLGGGIVNGCGLAGAYGKATLTFKPFLFEAAGNVEFMCVQAPAEPSVYLHVDGNGYVSAGTYFTADLDVIKLSGQETGNAYLDFADGKFHARFDGDVNASADFGFGTLSLSAEAMVSDVGMAACAEIDTPWHNYEAGFGAKYDLTELFSSPGGAFTYLANNLNFYSDGCNVNNYSVIPAAAPPAGDARTAQASGTYTLTIPAGQKSTIVVLSGPLGAPGAILHGPGGETVDASKAGEVAAAKALILHLGSATEIQLYDAPAGKWTIDPAPGTPPITSARTSHNLGTPSIKGRVSGSGADRILHYEITNLPAGAKVAFVENGSDGGKLLGVARGDHGTIKFSPSGATGGSRTILAEPTGADGSPMPTVKVTVYRASPPVPGRVRRIRVRRRGTTIVVAFSPSAGAALQLVSVRLSDRVRQGLVLGAGVRRFELRGIPQGVHASSIVIRGRNSDGVLGPPASTHGG